MEAVRINPSARRAAQAGNETPGTATSGKVAAWNPLARACHREFVLASAVAGETAPPMMVSYPACFSPVLAGGTSFS